ncbi:MAG: type II toxin-antitoxin system VapC family toxin [Geodermatophilaceae bacterium]|nr:type II toxin-antitoxin system VapC family toxin [Geodermatophilaceae bacterium]
MIVVDASAVLDVISGDPFSVSLLQRVAGQPWHAPHLIDLEVLHALRRLAMHHPSKAELAEAARAEFLALTITRYSHVGLRDRIWELRDSMTAYDAAYIALAEALDVPLVTTDARLGRAPGSRCAVEVF